MLALVVFALAAARGAGLDIEWAYGEQAVTVTAADRPVRIVWSGNHNVVAFATAADYYACANAGDALAEVADGDAVEIDAAASGTTTYYACGVYGHCGGGMKVAVTWDLGDEEACADDDSWYFKKQHKGCSWVAESPEKRCKKGAKIAGEDACALTCGTGAADSSTWYFRTEAKDCAWVAARQTATG
jgi:hypothetical protein